MRKKSTKQRYKFPSFVKYPIPSKEIPLPSQIQSLSFRAFPSGSRYPLYLFCSIPCSSLKLHTNSSCEINSRNSVKKQKRMPLLSLTQHQKELSDPITKERRFFFRSLSIVRNHSKKVTHELPFPIAISGLLF